MDKNIAPFLSANQVKVLEKPSLADAQATLAVPEYVAEAGLKTFADIARFKDKLGGKIYGIEPGSGANTTIKTMIDTNQFGLKDFKLIESGVVDDDDALAQQRRRQLFVGESGTARRSVRARPRPLPPGRAWSAESPVTSLGAISPMPTIPSSADLDDHVGGTGHGAPADGQRVPFGEDDPARGERIQRIVSVVAGPTGGRRISAPIGWNRSTDKTVRSEATLPGEICTNRGEPAGTRPRAALTRRRPIPRPRAAGSTSNDASHRPANPD